MRVALAILHADPARGGAERYTQDLAASLRERGHEATILAAAGPADVVLAADGWTRTGRYRAFAHAGRRHLDAGGFDVVHLMLPLPGIAADVYHPHAGIAVERGTTLSWLTNPRRRAMAAAERGLAGNGRTSFIALSDYVGRAIARHHPALPAGRVRTLYNGVDLGRYTPVGPVAGDAIFRAGPTALFVGNDWGRKGLDHVIRAVAAVPGLRLAVAGEQRGRLGGRFRQLALGLGDRVAFLGPRRDAPELYRAATVAVSASRHDPCSLATLEALASGLPVVGTPQDGATELMADGVHGRVVARDGLAEGLGDVLARRDAMRSALAGLRPTLSWDAHVDRVLGLYGKSP